MAKESMEQHTKSKHTTEKKTIFGHNIKIQGLNDWHQVCFKWCKYQDQQQANKTCSMYCFKRRSLKRPSSTKHQSDVASDTDINVEKTLKNVMSSFAEPLCNYSIVIVKGAETTIDEYTEATKEEYLSENPMTRHRNVREINLNDRVNTVLDNTELMVKKTYEFSKSLLHTWKTNNRNKWINKFDYNDTLYTIKSRAVKIMDVARGKYDDDINKSSLNRKKVDDDNSSSGVRGSDTENGFPKDD